MYIIGKHITLQIVILVKFYRSLVRKYFPEKNEQETETGCSL